MQFNRSIQLVRCEREFMVLQLHNLVLIRCHGLYVKPPPRTNFGKHGFRVAGPDAWNSLPSHLHYFTDTAAS